MSNLDPWRRLRKFRAGYRCDSDLEGEWPRAIKPTTHNRPSAERRKHLPDDLAEWVMILFGNSVLPGAPSQDNDRHV